MRKLGLKQDNIPNIDTINYKIYLNQPLLLIFPTEGSGSSTTGRVQLTQILFMALYVVPKPHQNGGLMDRMRNES